MSKETRAYNTKIIETSTYIEVYQYDEPIFYSYSVENENGSRQLDWLVDSNTRRSYDELPTIEKYDSLKRKQQHYEECVGKLLES